MRSVPLTGRSALRLLGMLLGFGGPGAASELVFRPADATLHGDGVLFDWEIPRQCLTDWSSLEAYATWEFETRGATNVRVSIEQACPAADVGGEYAVEISDSVVRGSTRPTRDANTFERIALGEVHISAAGRHTLRFRPLRHSDTGRLAGIRGIFLRGEHLAAVAPRYESFTTAARIERISERLWRFAPSADFAFDENSLCFATPPRIGRTDPGAPRIAPAFGLSTNNPARWFRPGATHHRPSAHVAIDPGTSLYGTGEVPGPLLRNGRVTMCWNTDAWGYNHDSTSLYQSHPWVLGVRADGSAFGVLADTTYRCEIDLRDGIRFTADGPPFGVYGIEAASPLEVVQELARWTGRMPPPPLWALGYQQCRWSYFPESRVREIAREFRERRIPCDVLWLDIDYMDGFRVFTFDRESFPSPVQLNSDLREMGFRTVWMIDPGVKIDDNYSVYRSGTTGDHWVKTADGKPFQGNVWPGPCVFPDYTRPETRAWWADLYQDFLAEGIDGVWNDMNEPSVFDVVSRTMPEESHHRGGGTLAPGPHARYHNVYGMLMVRATREGVLKARPGHRPFVLTRANFLGGQRYAATWTGDNRADWEHLYNTIPMIANLGLSGQPFAGPDIGGFAIGDGESDRLFARWMGIGALLPFARGHAAKDGRNKEPWEFSPEVEQSCRISLERRYRLLPYLYTQFHAAWQDGSPVLRPLFFSDPADARLRNVDRAFLIGADLLVLANPNETDTAPHAVPMPRGIWRKLWLIGEAERRDAHQPVLLLRGGAILPLGRVVQHTGEKMLDPLTLVVSPDASGCAAGVLYEDEGDGYGHESGVFLLTRYAAHRDGNEIVVRIASQQGELPRPTRKCVVEVLLDDGTARCADGNETQEIRVRLY